ncbi:Aldo/keto reductase [Dacryopinax primogenitus]|uniref:Aldo/keto reductase n=1 Tax=Dacryopinax primogenitus (strain DJM 731) TaxID=1858805 RepID=M5FN91_DACPD|nr:Aldo/keto reductase [Dacryopinax primogenitus]EJT97035.1 Aldo/keto reductase [Dacryopinax primogenitus]
MPCVCLSHPSCPVCSNSGCRWNTLLRRGTITSIWRIFTGTRTRSVQRSRRSYPVSSSGKTCGSPARCAFSRCRGCMLTWGKLWNNAHKPEEVEKQLDESLRQIGTDYLDLYLIHWPVAFVPNRGVVPKANEADTEVELDLETSLVETWKAMIALPKSKVRNIGVSNFSVAMIRAITAATGVLPAANQVECHPYLPQNELVEYAKETGLHLTAYSPLGNNLKNVPKLTEHDVIQSIASSIGATPAQVLIAWAVARGFTVIPKSVQNDRIESNFVQVDLSPEDVQKITAIGEKEHTRFNIPYYFVPRWNISVFGEPSEKEAKNQIKVE